MKAVIFAGGLGTRFSEQTQYMPKPMIEIGGKPILWHIMKYMPHMTSRSLSFAVDTNSMSLKSILPIISVTTRI